MTYTGLPSILDEAINALRDAATKFTTHSSTLLPIWPDATAFQARIDLLEDRARNADTPLAARIVLRQAIATGRGLEAALAASRPAR